MRSKAAFATLALLSACAPQAQPELPGIETAAAANQISPDGFGEIHIGISLAEARRTLGNALAALDALDDPDRCASVAYTTIDGQQLLLMFEGSRVTSVYAGGAAPSVRTPEGVGVGSTDAEVRAAYPTATEEPAKYDDPPAHNLIFWRAPNESGLRFEIGSDSKVTAINAGGPSILYVEGCA